MKTTKTTNKKTTTLAFSLLATLLVVAIAGTAFNEQQASAASYHRTNSSPYPQDVINRFAQFSHPIYLWHYNYNNKNEQKNLQAFIAWFCAPGFNGKVPTQCADIKTHNNKKEAIDLMRFVAVYGDSYAYDMAVKRTENKPTHTDLIRQGIVYDIDNHLTQIPIGSISDKAWQVFVKYERVAFHYDYTKADQLNLDRFTKYNSWMKLNEILQHRWMWYNEQIRDVRLYDVASAYANGHQVPVYFLPNVPTPPEKVTSSIVNSWISETGKKWDYLFKV